MPKGGVIMDVANAKEVKKIAVIGAGLMGSQIAEFLSWVGNYEVNIVAKNDEAVRKGLHAIEDRLERLFVSRGKLTAREKKSIVKRIKGSITTEEAVKEVDFVIEAATENLAIKMEIFRKLGDSAPPNAILASNTSYQSITAMASVTKNPERVVGMHFPRPVETGTLVMVIRGVHTSDETVKATCRLAHKLGKEPMVCRDTSYGFLANRAYMAMANEATQMVWERVASPEEIDRALKLSYGLPLGPLELYDIAGGWKLAATSEQDAIRELGPERGRLHPLVRLMLRAGYVKIYDFWKDVLSKW